MNVPVCDICKNVIHGKRYMVVVVPTTSEDTIEEMARNPRDYFQQRDDQRKIVEEGANEMCAGCKDLYDRLFKLRKGEAGKLKKASDAVLKKLLKEI